MILLVEDEPMLAEIIVEVLTTIGEEVKVVKSLRAAREELKRTRPELIITDCRVHDGTACELFDDNLDVPVLVMSGYVSPEDMMRVQQHPAFCGVLLKPFRVADLVARIVEITTGRRAGELPAG